MLFLLDHPIISEQWCVLQLIIHTDTDDVVHGVDIAIALSQCVCVCMLAL